MPRIPDRLKTFPSTEHEGRLCAVPADFLRTLHRICTIRKTLDFAEDGTATGGCTCFDWHCWVLLVDFGKRAIVCECDGAGLHPGLL